MALKIKDIPTQTLTSAQMAIEFASREMHGFFQSVLKALEENKVRLTYVKELEDSLEHKIEKNNEALEIIEKEVFSRVEKMFPGVTTSKHMPRIVEAYKQELAYVEKNAKKAPAKDKPVLSLNTSKEEKR